MVCASRLLRDPSLRERARAELAKNRLRGSAPSRLASVDMESLPGHKGGPIEVEDAVDHIADLAEPAQGMKVGHTRIGGEVVTRPDDPQRDRVHPNPA